MRLRPSLTGYALHTLRSAYSTYLHYNDDQDTKTKQKHVTHNEVLDVSLGGVLESDGVVEVEDRVVDVEGDVDRPQQREVVGDVPQ